MITAEWSELHGAQLLTVAASTPADGDVAQETGRSIAAALEALEAAGFRAEHIVRSRLFTRDADTRRQASDARRVLLAGALRGASSSFWDPARLCADTRVRIELTAMSPLDAQAAKEVVEYDPVIAPPKYVRLGGLVFLSGVTDVTHGLAAQVDAVRNTIDASLAAAGAHLRDACLMSVFLAREEDPRAALALIAVRFAEARCPVTLTQVGGYSAPEKRIEIEVTAAP
jgi:enamine deaminase RidA (YjgF/YER057c/UK114 family)